MNVHGYYKPICLHSKACVDFKVATPSSIGPIFSVLGSCQCSALTNNAATEIFTESNEHRGQMDS